MTQKNEMSARALTMEELEMVNGGNNNEDYTVVDAFFEWLASEIFPNAKPNNKK
ncbi:MAG: hypothetical protein IJ618_06590 [Prevotella sp.]|nr:hypothetical protein [Prevotella sp.]